MAINDTDDPYNDDNYDDYNQDAYVKMISTSPTPKESATPQ